MELLLHKEIQDRTLILRDELCLSHFLYYPEQVDTIIFLCI